MKALDVVFPAAGPVGPGPGPIGPAGPVGPVGPSGPVGPAGADAFCRICLKAEVLLLEVCILAT